MNVVVSTKRLKKSEKSEKSEKSGTKNVDGEAPTDLFMVLNEIGIINQLSSTRFERLLASGLTLAQFSVLNNFVRLGGTRTPAELASAFQVTKGAMTNTLKRLDASGCISIKGDPLDGRKKVVSITARGRKTRNVAIRATQGELNKIGEKLELSLIHI